MEVIDSYSIDHDLADISDKPPPGVPWMQQPAVLRGIPRQGPSMIRQQPQTSMVEHIDFLHTNGRSMHGSTNPQSLNVRAGNPSFLHSANKPVHAIGRETMCPPSLNRPSLESAHNPAFLGTPFSTFDAFNRPVQHQPIMNVIESFDERDFDPAYRAYVNQQQMSILGLSEQSAQGSNIASGYGPSIATCNLSSGGFETTVQEQPSSQVTWLRQEPMKQPPSHSIGKESINRSVFGPTDMREIQLSNTMMHALSRKNPYDLSHGPPLQPIRAATALHRPSSATAPVVDVPSFGRPAVDISAFGPPKLSAIKPSNVSTIAQPRNKVSNLPNTAPLQQTSAATSLNSSSCKSAPVVSPIVFGKTKPNAYKPLPGISHATPLQHGQTKPENCMNGASITSNDTQCNATADDTSNGRRNKARPSSPFGQLYLKAYDDMLKKAVAETKTTTNKSSKMKKMASPPTVAIPVERPPKSVDMERASKPVSVNDPESTPSSVMGTQRQSSSPSTDSSFQQLSYETSVDSVHTKSDENGAHTTETIASDESSDEETNTSVSEKTDELNIEKTVHEFEYILTNEKVTHELEKKPVDEKATHELAYIHDEVKTTNESAYKNADENNTEKSKSKLAYENSTQDLANKPSDDKAASYSLYKSDDEVKTAKESASKVGDDKTAHQNMNKPSTTKHTLEAAHEITDEKKTNDTTYETAYQKSSQEPGYDLAQDPHAHEPPRESLAGHYCIRPSNKPASETAIHEPQQRQPNSSQSRKLKQENGRFPLNSPQHSPRQNIRSSSSDIDFAQSHMAHVDSRNIGHDQIQLKQVLDIERLPVTATDKPVVPLEALNTDTRVSRPAIRQQRTTPGRIDGNSADRRQNKQPRQGKSQMSPDESLLSDFSTDNTDDSKINEPKPEIPGRDTNSDYIYATKATNRNADSRSTHRVQFDGDDEYVNKPEHDISTIRPVESPCLDLGPDSIDNSNRNMPISEKFAGETGNVGVCVPSDKTESNENRPTRRVRFSTDLVHIYEARHAKSTKRPVSQMDSPRSESTTASCSDLSAEKDQESIVESSSIASDFSIDGSLYDTKINRLKLDPHANRETISNKWSATNPETDNRGSQPPEPVIGKPHTIEEQIFCSSKNQVQDNIHAHSKNPKSSVNTQSSVFTTKDTDVLPVNSSRSGIPATIEPANTELSAIQSTTMCTSCRHSQQPIFHIQTVGRMNVNMPGQRITGKSRYDESTMSSDEPPSSGLTSTYSDSSNDKLRSRTYIREPAVHETTLKSKSDRISYKTHKSNATASEDHSSKCRKERHKDNSLVILRDEPTEARLKTRKKRAHGTVCKESQTKAIASETLQTNSELQEEDIVQLINDQLGKLGIVFPCSTASRRKLSSSAPINPCPIYHRKLSCGIKKSDLIMKIDAIAQKHLRNLLPRWHSEHPIGQIINSNNGDLMLQLPEHNMTPIRTVKKKKSREDVPYIETLVRNILLEYISQCQRKNTDFGVYGDGKQPRPDYAHIKLRKERTKSVQYVKHCNGQYRTGPFIAVSDEEDDEEYEELIKSEKARFRKIQSRRRKGRQRSQKPTNAHNVQQIKHVAIGSYTCVNKIATGPQIPIGIRPMKHANVLKPRSFSVTHVHEKTQKSEKNGIMPMSRSTCIANGDIQTRKKLNRSHSRDVSKVLVPGSISKANYCTQTSDEVNNISKSRSNSVIDDCTQTSETLNNMSKSRSSSVTNVSTETRNRANKVSKPNSISVANECSQSIGQDDKISKSRSQTVTNDGYTQLMEKVNNVYATRVNKETNGRPETSEGLHRATNSQSNRVKDSCIITSDKIDKVTNSQFNSVTNGGTQISEKTNKVSKSQSFSVANIDTQTVDKNKLSKLQSVSATHIRTQTSDKIEKPALVEPKTCIKGRITSMQNKSQADIHLRRQSSCVYPSSSSDNDAGAKSTNINRNPEDAGSCPKHMVNVSTKTNEKVNPDVGKQKPDVGINTSSLKSETRNEIRPKSSCMKSTSNSDSDTLGNSYDYSKHAKNKESRSDSLKNVCNETVDNVEPADVEPTNGVITTSIPPKKDKRVEIRRKRSSMYPTSSSDTSSDDDFLNDKKEVVKDKVKRFPDHKNLNDKAGSTDKIRGLMDNAEPMDIKIDLGEKKRVICVKGHGNGENISYDSSTGVKDSKNNNSVPENKVNKIHIRNEEDVKPLSEAAKISLDPGELKKYVKDDEYDDEGDSIRPGVWRCELSNIPVSAVDKQEGEAEFCGHDHPSHMSLDFDDDTVDTIDSNEIYQEEAVSEKKHSVFSRIKNRIRNIFK